MNKCSNCGAQFEGKFCPECGMKVDGTKTCPECGTQCLASQKFCNECGYNFMQSANGQNAAATSVGNNKPKHFSLDIVGKIYTVLRYVPCILIMLFSLLVFAFYAAPVAIMPGGNFMGENIPAESYGNVYSMYSGILSEIPELKSAMLTIIILAVVGVVYAATTGIIFFLPQTKYKEVSLFGKSSAVIGELFAAISVVVYIVFLIVGSVIMTKISALDDGAGVMVAGACPKLLVAFSVVFLILSIIAVAVRMAMSRKLPELALAELQKRQEAIESVQIEKERFFAAHSAPQEPAAIADNATKKEKKEHKRACVAYKHNVRRYNRAKEGGASVAVVWMDLHKVQLIIVAILIAVVVVATLITVSILSNIFRIGKVSKIALGASPSSVREILGNPYEPNSSETLWRYYDDEYLEIAEKLNKNSEKQEAAMMDGKLEELAKLVVEETELREKLSALTYKYIEIEFVQNADENGETVYEVSSVLLDAKKCDGMLGDRSKEIKKIDGVNFDLGYCIDNTSGSNNITLVEYSNKSYEYKSEFSDGSYYHSKLSSVQTDFADTADVTIKWQDQFTSYEIVRKAIKIGEVSSNGKWSTESENADKIERLILPNCVTSIGKDAFVDCISLTRIVIPDSVVSIEYGAFRGCSNIIQIENGIQYVDKWAIDCDSSILSVSLRDDTVGIGCKAFENCSSLTSITIPNSVTSIGSNVFHGCSRLSNIYYTGDIASWCGISGIGNLYLSEVYIGNRKLIDMTSIEIPNDVTRIESNAFYGCSSLTSIEIPNSVTSIGSNTFENCSSLTSITIPNSVTSIGDEAFSGCSSLTNITIGNSVTSIGNNAFHRCSWLSNIYYTGDIASWCGISGIGNLYLSKVYIGNRKLVDMTSIEIPNDVTRIESNAFYGCNSLTSITIPNSVTRIGSSAFYGCSKLTSVTLPDSVTSIGDGTFSGCSSLTNITIGNSVTSIGSNAFGGCSGLASIEVSSGNKKYYSKSNCILERATKKLVLGCKNSIIPNDGSVTSIGSMAFSGCDKLTNITIPNSVTSIGDRAFYGCSKLTSVTLPDGVTSIGDRAFYGCSSLTSIEIPNGVKSIGDCAFA